MTRPIFIAPSFDARPCHVCGKNDGDTYFIRIRNQSHRTDPKEPKAPSELYLRLCEDHLVALRDSIQFALKGRG